MRRKLSSFFIILFTSLSFSFAQVSVSPDEDFYTDVIGWQLKEYIYFVPQIRPFPVNTVKAILNKVSQCGVKVDEERAQYYYEKYFGKNWSVQASAGYTEVIQSIEDHETDLKEKYSASVYADGDYDFNSFAGFSFKAGINGFNKYGDNNLLNPYSKYDSTKTLIDGFSVYNDDFAMTFDINATGSIGSEDTYLSFGINKSSFGLYPETSLNLSSQAYQTLNATFNHTGKYFEYSHMLAALTAKNIFSDNKFKMNKFLAFHSIRLPVFSQNLHLSYFESAVWGEGFLPGYVLPVPFVIMGNVDGFNENLMAGIMLEWQPVTSLKFNLNINIDDFKPKKLIKLKLDSGVRTAFQTGIEYSPVDSLCNLITLNYTMATPYTYTFFDTRDSSYNYGDYTNMGIPVALDLPPNSDRISFGLSFRPSERLSIRTNTSFIRHANAYESMKEQEILDLNKSGKKYLSDGSINSVDNDTETACDFTNFMSQDTQMFVIQGEIGIDYAFVIKKMSTVSLTFGYTFEYFQNYGIDRNIYTGNETTVEEVAASKNAWKNSLIDKYNHYFSIGLKFTY